MHHYRAHADGNWSDNNNWTLGLAPAAVHPVVIDSPAGVKVTGSATGTTNVKSLRITAGNELSLIAGSTLGAAEGVTLESGASLTGSGTLVGDVFSAGTLSPGHSAGEISIDGDYTQTGSLLLELLNGDPDRLHVTGTANLAGDIYVNGVASVGQSFQLIDAAEITGTPIWHLPETSTLQLIALPGGGQAMQVTYAPEPAGAIILVAGVVCVGRRRRRR